MNTRLAFVYFIEISSKLYFIPANEKQNIFHFSCRAFETFQSTQFSKDIILRFIIYLSYGKLRFIIQQDKETSKVTHQKYRPSPFL